MLTFIRFELVLDTRVIVLAALTPEDQSDWNETLSALLFHKSPAKKLLPSTESTKAEEKSSVDNEQIAKDIESPPITENKQQQLIDENRPTICEQQAVKIEELNLDKARLEESLANLLDDRKGLEAKFTSLNQEKAQLLKEIAAIKFENEELQQKFALEKEKNQLLIIGTQPIEELQARAKAKLISLERKIDLERSKTNTIQAELEKTVESLKTEQQKNEQLRKEVLKLHQETIESGIKLTEATTTITQLERDLVNKVEFIRNSIMKENDYAMKIEALEKTIIQERNRGKQLEQEISKLVGKAELYDKKYVSETLITPQEKEFLSLTIKLMGLESDLKFEKNRTEQLTAENIELKDQLTSCNEKLESKTEAFLEEKSSLNFKLLNANQKTAQLQLKLDRISNQLQLEREQNDSPEEEDEEQKSALLESFATVVNALFKNLHLGYQNFDKTEDQLLQELEKVLEKLIHLRSFAELYSNLKAKLQDLKETHRYELEQKETMVSSLLKKVEELENKLNDSSTEKKALLEEIALKEQQKEEALRRMLHKIEEFSVCYESIVKTLFMAMNENTSKRKNSVSCLSRLEDTAAEHKQFSPFLGLYRFLEEQIRKELLELRDLKIGSPPETRSRIFMRQLSEGQKTFIKYFIDLVEHKIPISERAARMNLLREFLENARSLTALHESIPELQEKVENVIKPLEQMIEQYDKELSTAANRIQALIDENTFLKDALAKSHQEYLKSQELLKEAKYSIQNLERRFVLVEESCVTLRSLMQDIENNSQTQNSLSFDLTITEKEERLQIIIKEIPQLYQLNEILEIFKLFVLRGKPKIATVNMRAKKDLSLDKHVRTVQNGHTRTKSQTLVSPKVALDSAHGLNKSFMKRDIADTNQSVLLTEACDIPSTARTRTGQHSNRKSSDRIVFAQVEPQKKSLDDAVKQNGVRTVDTVVSLEQKESENKRKSPTEESKKSLISGVSTRPKSNSINTGKFVNV